MVKEELLEYPYTPMLTLRCEAGRKLSVGLQELLTRVEGMTAEQGKSRESTIRSEEYWEDVQV